MFVFLGIENNWERMWEYYYIVKIFYEYVYVFLIVFFWKGRIEYCYLNVVNY